MKVIEIAEWLGLPFEGEADRNVQQAAPIESAGPAQIAFATPKKAQREVEASHAGCLIVPQDFDNAGGHTIIRAKDPRTVFAKIVARLHPPRRPEPGVHPSAVVSPSAQIGEGVAIGPMAVVSDDVVLGERTSIGAQCFLGRGARIGADCTLHSGVKIYDHAEVGARTILHSGVVLGADGFGVARTASGYEKFPQIGRVVVGCDVEMGANTTVDRAALGATTIGDGAKFDNLVHVGHNCTIGKHVIIVAQTGVAGGSVIEDWCVIGGQVGIGDNVRIKSGAILGSKSGVLTGKILPGNGQVYWGVPARPLKQYLEILALEGRLPEMKAALDSLLKLVPGSGKPKD
jgi:UDP-3-O-[3-hydroxymyristoyl] glucosamine N-acyltransferase